MTQKEYEITIEPNGQVRLHIKGIKGSQCMDIAKLFEQIVGKEVSKDLTSEFYEPAEQVRLNIEQRH